MIAKERSYKGGNVCIFNEFARAFPGSESMGTLEETRFPCRIYGFFFLALLFRFPEKKESENVSKESSNWCFNC